MNLDLIYNGFKGINDSSELINHIQRKVNFNDLNCNNWLGIKSELVNSNELIIIIQ